MKNVGIIGGSGYIGSHITKKFLEAGHHVRVGTTVLAKKEKYTHLHQLPNAKNLEVVQLDVENKVELRAFMAGLNVVVHGGTPFQLEVADPKKDLFDPTINGTINFLAAIQQEPSIEKVVFIASVAAYNTNFPLPTPSMGTSGMFSEKDKPFTSDESHPYAQAKFIANATVNKFIADHPELPFEITSVSPVGVMGMALSARQDSTSMGIQHLFKHKIAPNPFIQMFYDNDIEWAVVDVADVADGVFQAATKQGIHGRNYLLSAESYHVSDIHALLNGNDPAKKPRVIYANDLAKKELGISFRPARETLEQYAELIA